MDIRCPLCNAEFPEPEPGPQEPLCPNCGAILTVEMDSPGFAIVSGEEGPPPEEGAPEAAREQDPILEDHAKWRLRSLGLIVAGIVGLIGVGLASYSDWTSYGAHFFFSQKNRVALIAIVSVLLFAILLGAFIFFLVRRETRIYLMARAQRPPSAP